MKNTHINLREEFQTLGSATFSLLNSNEKMRLSLSGESTQYIRYSQGKVRHNHFVDQVEITCTYQSQQKELKQTFTMSAQHEINLQFLREFLQNARIEIQALPSFNSFVPLSGSAKVSIEKKGDIPPLEYFLKAIPQQTSQDDFVGFLAAGDQYKASITAEGEFLWFQTQSFFLDYSIYDGPRAAKNTYSGRLFNESEWQTNLAETRNKLNLLKKPRKKLAAQGYRVYLEPAAMADLLGMMVGWEGSGSVLSYASYKQGLSPFKDFIDGHRKLSEKFTLTENFELGFSPYFNSTGELSPEKLILISQGQLSNMMISSRSANEFNVAGNRSESSEVFRSPDISPGTLKRADILKKLDCGIYLSNLHYLNWSDMKLARVTGMTRFACFWVENGEIVSPIEDLRFDISLYDVFGKDLIDLDEKSTSMMDIMTYAGRSLGGYQTPGAMIENFTFTL